MNTATESEKNAALPDAPKGKRAIAKKARPPKKAARAGKPASKPKADRANKKAEVIAMMKRAKGATLAKIIAAKEWQALTVRGFMSIPASKGGEKIESPMNAGGRADLQDREIGSGNSLSKRCPATRRWQRFCIQLRVSDVTDRQRARPL